MFHGNSPAFTLNHPLVQKNAFEPETTTLFTIYPETPQCHTDRFFQGFNCKVMTMTVLSVRTDMQIRRLPRPTSGNQRYAIEGYGKIAVLVGQRKTVFRGKLTKPDGSTTTATLGEIGDMTIKEALAELERRQSELLNPLQAFDQKITDNPSDFALISRRFIEHKKAARRSDGKPKMKQSSYLELVRLFENYLIPFMRGRNIEEIQIPVVNQFLKLVRTKQWPHPKTGALSGGEDVARRCTIYLKAVAQWCLHEFTHFNSPLLGLSTSHFDYQRRKRDRYLTRHEVAAFHEAIDSRRRMAPATRLGLKILLLIPCRVGELNQAKWSDVNDDCTIWHSPNTKNGHPIDYPLGPYGQALFKELKKSTGSSGMLLGGMDEKTLGRRLKELQTPRKDGTVSLKLRERVKPHDLRRSAATFMASMGVPRHIVKKSLNHISGSVTDIYVRSPFLEERLDATTRYGEALLDPIQKLPRTSTLEVFEAEGGMDVE